METGTVDELVDAVARVAPTYGGINLEDISAPRCFEIERRLQERLDIPVFHDDQHGTAIVSWPPCSTPSGSSAGSSPTSTVVVSGAGAAGVAVSRILLRAGVGDVVVVRLARRARHAGRDGPAAAQAASSRTHQPPRGRPARIGDALAGADVLIGVSGGTVARERRPRMAPRAMIFALANPDPEVHPAVAARFAEVVATGRSDFPNQINNVLAFPGIFRGALDSGARRITEEMKLAAAYAIAGLVDAADGRPDRAERVRRAGGAGRGGGGASGRLSPQPVGVPAKDRSGAVTFVGWPRLDPAPERRRSGTPRMRVLITGGAGFIGSNLARAALAEGHEIVVLDDLSTGYAANLDGLRRALPRGVGQRPRRPRRRDRGRRRRRAPGGARVGPAQHPRPGGDSSRQRHRHAQRPRRRPARRRRPRRHRPRPPRSTGSTPPCRRASASGSDR